jgi:hypothetical protein
MFKLDGIQLDDKVNEYKNLLKAMGALYFANKHTRIVAYIFHHWRILTHQKMQNGIFLFLFIFNSFNF